MTKTDMVNEFHAAFMLPIGDKPELPDDSVRDLRWDLLVEEMLELQDAEADDDIVGIADALADLVYFAIGTAVAYGIPFDEVFGEVHRSNMTKLDKDGNVIYREDGKVLKPDTWEPPRIKEILDGNV